MGFFWWLLVFRGGSSDCISVFVGQVCHWGMYCISREYVSYIFIDLHCVVGDCHGCFVVVAPVIYFWKNIKSLCQLLMVQL